jgi:hypothetical protein
VAGTCANGSEWQLEPGDIVQYHRTMYTWRCDDVPDPVAVGCDRCSGDVSWLDAAIVRGACGVVAVSATSAATDCRCEATVVEPTVVTGSVGWVDTGSHTTTGSVEVVADCMISRLALPAQRDVSVNDLT